MSLVIFLKKKRKGKRKKKTVRMALVMLLHGFEVNESQLPPAISSRS